MNKENEFNLNLSYNSNEEVPIISKSNKSKSNSLKDQNSIRFPKKLNNTLDNQNSYSFSIRHRMKKKSNDSFSFNTLTQDKIFIYNDQSEDSKEKSKENKSRTEKKENKINLLDTTPKKKSEKNIALLDTFKNKKRDVLYIDNIKGKNLMEYFEKMSENIDNEKKNDNNRVSSVGNKINNSIKLNIKEVTTNKSWNKNKYCFLISKNPLKIINKNNIITREKKLVKIPYRMKTQSGTSNYTSNIKNLQNILNQNNINLDLKNLIDKYRPSQIKKEPKNSTVSIKKITNDKKLSYEKIKKTPNTDIHKRKLSFSHLKLGETLMKNLFQDYNKKKDEITNVNKFINPNEKFLDKKKTIFQAQLKNKTTDKFFNLNKNNIKNPAKNKQNDNINNIQKINNYYLKYKEKNENKKK